jgi:WD40 repeat protein
MSPLPKLMFQSIDELEAQNRAVSPFVRMFAIYTQFTSTIAILATSAFIVFSLIYFPSGPTDIQGFLQLLSILAVLLCLMLTVVIINAALGMLNWISAIVLFVAVTLPVLPSMRGIAPLFVGASPFRELSPFSANLLRASDVVCICFLFYLYVRAFIAMKAMFRMSVDDRAILKSLPGGVTVVGKIWHRLRSLPPVFEFIGKGPRAVLVGALAQISVFLLATATFLFFTMFVRLSVAAEVIAKDCSHESELPRQEECAIGAVIGVFYIMPIAVPLLFLLGALVQRLVRRLLRLSLEQLQLIDPRPPMLFLRAFRDDQVDLRPPKLTFLGWLTEFGQRKTNLDHVLLEEGTPYGPVVAIGKPDDRFPPYGAARGYFDNKTWQQAVGGLVKESAAIVLCVDDTEGIWWEIEHLAGAKRLRKVLFLLHPRHAGNAQNAALTTRLLKAIGGNPEELNYPGGRTHTLSVFVDSDGGIAVTQSRTFSRVAFILALRQFLRGKLGMQPIPLRVRYGQQSTLPAAKISRPSRRATLIGSAAAAAAAGIAGVAAWIMRAPSPYQLVILSGHTSLVKSAAFSPDGSRIVTASSDMTARLWDGRSEVALAILSGHTGGVESAAFSPDGSRIVTASSDKTARLWDGRSGAALATLSGHYNWVVSAAFSPDGSRVVTASWDKTARLWDGKSGEALATLSGHTDSLYSAAFSPDGSRIVTGSLDNTARLWDGGSGAALAILSGHTSLVKRAAFSPDGSRIVTASWDKTARLWDGRSGAALATLSGHTYLVESAAFSPDGSRVVTASWDKTARLWDGRSGAALAILSGHTDFVESAAFSPDGSRIVTASRDETARLWDGRNGAALATLSGHYDWVVSAAFSPDGSRVVTASEDKTARLWNVKEII